MFTLLDLYNSSFYPTEERITKTRSDDGDVIKLQVPGCSKEDLTLELNQNYFIVNNKLSNISTKIFAGDVDKDKVKASVKNGVLTIIINRDRSFINIE